MKLTPAMVAQGMNEDDGIGLPETPKQPNKETGEHIGLSIMRDRARKINGEIQFDSDEGEGTLVQLNFDIKRETNSVVTNFDQVAGSRQSA